MNILTSNIQVQIKYNSNSCKLCEIAAILARSFAFLSTFKIVESSATSRIPNNGIPCTPDWTYCNTSPSCVNCIALFRIGVF